MRFHSQLKLAFATSILSVFVLVISASAQTDRSAADKSASQDPGASQKGTKSQDTAELTAVPNRPTFSTTAEAVQNGVLEIEYGFEAADGHQNINGLIKFGLLKNLELRFANNPFARDAGHAGSGDSGTGFKYRVFSQTHALPTFSILYTASLATSSIASGIASMGHAVDLLASKDFGRHHFDFNEGAHFLGKTPSAGSGFDRTYFTALSYTRPIVGKWGGSAELAGFSRANSATPATMTLLVAAAYNLSPRLILDCGESTAVYGNLPRVTFFGGITYSIADLYHRGRSARVADAPSTRKQ